MAVGRASRSSALRLKIGLAEPRLKAVAGRFWAHPDLRQLMPEFMVMLHTVIRASVPLMEAARDRASELAPHDPVAAGVADYLGHHIPEELGHDDWLLEDLVAIGVDRDEVLGRVPSPAVASTVGAQYYWALHAHPVSLLGYLAVLEGDPPDADQLDGIRERTGLPDAAFRTMHKHARLDPHHKLDLERALDALPLTAAQATLVTRSAFHAIESISLAFEELLAAHERRERAAG